MSHFSVLVIGENPEEQLAPFHEFECTGNNNQYVQDVDITQEILDRMKDDKEELEEALDYYGLAERQVESQEEVDTDGEHKYGYALVLEGILVKAVNRTNQSAKWDWYQVGGRWTGFYKMKKGVEGLIGRPGLMTPAPEEGYADQCMVGDVDFAGMRDEAGDKARKLYQAVASVFGGTIPRLEKTWAEVREDKSLSIDEKRTFYHAQAPLALYQQLRKDDKLPESLKDHWMLDLEDFAYTEEEYVQQARDGAIVPFAFVRDSKWYERGEMGWWGCVGNEKDKGLWSREFNVMMDSLPANTLLTLVDCHI